jgi:hypothetical protein
LPYESVEDIVDIETSRVDFRKINSLMKEVLSTTRLALKHPYNFKKRLDWEDELRQYLRNQLLIYETTHDSIHVLLKFALRKKHYPPVVDAASLCREQIEKVFAIALALSNPRKWVKQYLRGTWRKDTRITCSHSKNMDTTRATKSSLGRLMLTILNKGSARLGAKTEKLSFLASRREH